MTFMLEEYKDVKVGKKFIKQAGQIEFFKTDDDKYKVKVYGTEDKSEIIFKTPEEASYFAVTWKKPSSRTKYSEAVLEVAESIRTCEYENREYVRQLNSKKKHVSLWKRFKKWLIKKLEKSLKE